MKIFFSIAICSFFILFATNSCKTTQKALSEQEIATLPKVLEFSKSACRGRCPYFDLTVYEGGWMIFEGKRFTEHEGKATDKLSKDAFAQLQQNCQAADLWKHQADYGMNVMDIPTTTVHFYEKDRDKKIQWRMRAPKALPTLSQQIMELIYDRNWVKRPVVQKEEGRKLPVGVLDNEIIVHFEKGTKVDTWCKKYEQYSMASKRILSAASGIYLIVFDTATMNPDKMLAIIKKDKQVQKAEFNKRLQKRNR